VHKKFLKPDTIGVIPTGGYTGNDNCGRKSLMWMVYREKTDGGRKIMYVRNGREYRLPELHHYSVDGFCQETRSVYEFLGCYYHGHAYHPYRDVTTILGVTLAERYMGTMKRIEEITRAGYQVEVQWECEFDEEILTCHPDLKTSCNITQSSQHARCLLRRSN